MNDSKTKFYYVSEREAEKLNRPGKTLSKHHRQEKKMKKTSKPTSSPPANVFDAKQALRNGEEHPVGWYLEDAGEILSIISDCLDPPNGNQIARSLQFGAEPSDVARDLAKMPQDDLGEWVGSPAQIKAAIASGSPEPLGWYARELGDFLGRLASAFNPPEQSRGWRLKFVRKGRGKRSDPMEQMFRDSDSAAMLRMATRKAGKQEAAIAELKGRPGASRANLFKRKHRARMRSESR